MLGAGAANGSPTSHHNSLGEFQWAKCEGVSLACVHERNNGSLEQLLALLSYRKNVTKFRVRGPIQGLSRTINLHVFRLIEYISGHSFQFDCVPNASFFGGQCLACRKCTFEFEYIVFDEGQDTWAALVTLNEDDSSACQPALYHRNLTGQMLFLSSQLESLPCIMQVSELQLLLKDLPHNNSRTKSIIFAYPHGDIRRVLLSSLHDAGFVAKTKIGSHTNELLECPPRFHFLRRPRISRYLGTLMIIPVCRPGHTLSYFLRFANADVRPESHAFPLMPPAPSPRIFEVKEPPVALLTHRTPVLLRSPPPRAVIDLLTDELNEGNTQSNAQTSTVVNMQDVDLICFSSSEDEALETRPRPKIVYTHRPKSMQPARLQDPHLNSLLDCFECPAPTKLEPVIEAINAQFTAPEISSGNNEDKEINVSTSALPNNAFHIEAGVPVDPMGSDPSSVDDLEVFVVKRRKLSANLALVCSENDIVAPASTQLPLSPSESQAPDALSLENETIPFSLSKNQFLPLPASSSSAKVGDVSVPLITLPKDYVWPPQKYWLRDPINKWSGEQRILEFVPPESDHVDGSLLQELYPLTSFVIKDSLLVADMEKTALDKLISADLNLMQARLLINGLEKLVPSAMEENALFRMVLVQNIQELTKQQYQALIGVASSVGRIDSVYRLLLLYINHKKSTCQCILSSASEKKSIKDLFWTTEDYRLLESLRDVHQGEVDYCLASRSMNGKPCHMIRYVFENTHAVDRSLQLVSRTSTHCRCESCSFDTCACLKVFSECDPSLCACCTTEDSSKLCQQLSNHDSVSVAIRPSPVHGWGCFADEIIEAGQLIMEYCGEIISSSEARRRALWYDMKTGGGNYIFALNDDYLIDAAFVGSDVRFCNHAPSSAANAQAIVMNVQGILRIGIYAKKRISPSEEITFDYGDHYTTLETLK